MILVLLIFSILCLRLKAENPTLPSFFGSPRQFPSTQAPFSFFGNPRPFFNSSPAGPQSFFGVPVPKANPKVSPGNLTCYACRLDFRKGYETAHPCLGRHGTDLSDQYLVNCGPSDIYCRVERTEVNGMLIFLTRECIDTCYYGCRPKGFGISFESCAECCQDFACNNFYPESNATQPQKSFLIALLSVTAFRGWHCFHSKHP